MRASKTAAALPAVTALVGAWAILPPYVGPAFNAEPRVEIADHVIPGAIVILLAAVALVAGRRSPNVIFIVTAGVTLAGLWMTATHVPLVFQAVRGQVSGLVALWHLLPGTFVAVTGLAWSRVYAHAS